MKALAIWFLRPLNSDPLVTCHRISRSPNLIFGESLMKTLLVPCCAVLLAAAPSVAETMLFDFGNTARQSPQPPNVPTWNNVVPATTQLFALFNSDGGIVPGASLEITDTFFQTGEPSQLGAENPSGDAAGYPVDATDDYFFGHTTPFAGAPENPYGEVTLSGLDPSQAYDFTFFSSRNGVNDNRETNFEVTGDSAVSGVAVTSNNQSEVLRFLGVLPDANGDIVIGVSPGAANDNNNGFYYINLMEVSTSIPEPTSAAILLVSGLILAAKRRRV